MASLAYLKYLTSFQPQPVILGMKLLVMNYLPTFDSIKCVITLVTFENNVSTCHKIATGQCLMFNEFNFAVEPFATLFTDITLQF